MLTNPGWLLSKTWAWGARLPFSLYIKQVREYKKTVEERTLKECSNLYNCRTNGRIPCLSLFYLSLLSLLLTCRLVNL